MDEAIVGASHPPNGGASTTRTHQSAALPSRLSCIIRDFFARRRRASMSAYFTNRLTPPASLGLLALSSRRVLPGRAARGSVVPRKMACPLARGAFHADCGSRPSTRVQGRGSSVAAPSNWEQARDRGGLGRDRRGNKKPRLPRRRERGKGRETRV
jgi:hypothetical protein